MSNNADDTVGLARVRQMVSTGEARRIRLHAGLSLQEMGDGVGDGVDAVTVLRWETSQRRPRGEAALAYLELLRRLAAQQEAVA